MHEKWHGVHAVILTPFTDDERLDEVALRDHIRFLIDEGGVHGIIPTGSTGEFASLSEAERKRVVELTVDEVAGEVPVVVGSAANGTGRTIMYAQYAEQVGADGVMIVPPYYCQPDAREIYEHYRAVAESITIPMMVYNNPATSGVDITPALFARLAEIENISYVKEATGDIKRIGAIKRRCGDRLTLFIGCDHVMFESFLMGAVGWVAGSANIVPELCVRLYDLVMAGGLDEARSLYYRMLPLGDMLELEGKFVQYLKAGARIVGRPLGPPRRPLLPPVEGDRQRLERALDELLG